MCISYTSDVMAVKHVSADIEKNTITAIMGPSGCGKSTLLRAVNRMHELYKNIRVTGEILLNGENVLQMHPMEERRRIGMVFQRPNPFPTMNIYDNVLAGYILMVFICQNRRRMRLWNVTCATSVCGMK